MARPKTRAATAPDIQSNAFLDALKFVGMVTNDKGPPNETHVYLNNKAVSAFNGIVAAGQKIDEDIFCAPNNRLLVEALSKCGEHMSITQLDNYRLSIKSDKFKAIVPCIDPYLLAPAIPDQPIAVIDDRLKPAFEAVGVLASADADNVVTASILINNGSAFATNRSVIFEYYHGIDLPPNLVLPKAIVQPLIKSGKKLSKFGYSPSSATFYFEDESWLRSQFYSDAWPEVRHILDVKSNPFPVPPDFFKGLAAIAPFSVDGQAYLKKEMIHSHDSPILGASYEVPGLPEAGAYNIKYLAMIQPHAEKIDFIANANRVKMITFFGKQIRGVLAGRS